MAKKIKRRRRSAAEHAARNTPTVAPMPGLEGMKKPMSRPKGNVSGNRGAASPRAPGVALEAYRRLKHAQDPLRFPAPTTPTVHEVITLDQRHPGQPPSLVQRACRLEFEKRIPMLCRIADGDECRVYEVLANSGEVVPMMVQPTIVERLKAMEVLAKVGQLYQVLPERGAEDGDAAGTKLNLAALSDAQLETLERILKVATATPVPFTTEAS